MKNRYGDKRRGPQHARRGKRAKLLPRMQGWVLEPADVEQVPLAPRKPHPSLAIWQPHLDAILLLTPGQAYEIELPSVFGRPAGDPRKLADRVRGVLDRSGVRAAMPYRLEVRATARFTVIVKCLGLPSPDPDGSLRGV